MGEYFGTDGVRGRVGVPPMVPEFVLSLGRAAGRQLGGPVLIGRDTRGSGPMLEAALVSGLFWAGVEVQRLGVLPTPGVAYLVGARGAGAGAVLSASHNPYYDNGVKFFGAGGAKLSDAEEAAIERSLKEAFPYKEGGRVLEAPEGEREYLEHLLGHAGDLNGFKIVVDAAHGATYRLAPELFSRAGAQVFAIGTSPDGKNINSGLGATAPETMARLVQELGYDLGVAFDGDGDRAIFADPKGRIFNGDHLLYMVAKVRGLKRVVGTVMSNYGLELALKEMGAELVRAKVGDRYVAEKMEETGATVGAEPSGHVIFKELFTTGDGMLTALVVLGLLKETGSALSDWVEALSLFPQVIKNVPVRDKRKVMGHPELKVLIEAARARLGEGRINVRPSGTEPVVRVMVEGRDREWVERIAEELAERVAALE